MPAAWDCGDNYLGRMLASLISQWGFQSITVCLFKNDVIPVPGITLDDFEEADFPGYSIQMFLVMLLGDVTITDHIASTNSEVELPYTGEAGSWSTQNIYGYFALDWEEQYFYSERFSMPFEMRPGGIIKITPRLRHRTAPP